MSQEATPSYNELIAPVYIPLLNPNEPDALLTALHVVEAQHVEKGDPLCTLETTKSAADVIAETSGYVLGLRFSPGQNAPAGEILCFLASNPEAHLPKATTFSKKEEKDLLDGLRITKPALALARLNNLDLDLLPKDSWITESMVQEILDSRHQAASVLVTPAAHGENAVLIYGGGGHGKSLIEAIRAQQSYAIAGVIDDGLAAGDVVLGSPVLGGGDTLQRYHSQGIPSAINAVGGIGNVGVRIKVFERLTQAGFNFPTIVHPSAWVEPSATLSAGAQILPLAYVGSSAQIGFGCIVNTGAIISHDCLLEEYVIISPGAVLAGEVHVGRGALIGMGVTINLRVRIGAAARIGNGATVKADVPERGVVRAGSIWPD